MNVDVLFCLSSSSSFLYDHNGSVTQQIHKSFKTKHQHSFTCTTFVTTINKTLNQYRRTNITKPARRRTNPEATFPQKLFRPDAKGKGRNLSNFLLPHRQPNTLPWMLNCLHIMTGFFYLHLFDFLLLPPFD